VTVSRYLAGIVFLSIALLPVHMASYLWRSRLLGEWTGAQARLAEIVADLTVVICVAEILGSLHLFSVAPVLVAMALVGITASLGARRFTWVRSEALAPSPKIGRRFPPRVANAAALVAVSVVVAEWSTKTVAAYHHGMPGTDTLWYHMPFAARFVQDGSITALHYVDSDPLTAFFPATSELIHSLGILLMGNDVLSPLLNTLWLGLALLASWCIGRPFGAAPLTLMGSAILFATPGLVGSQPGEAYDDAFGLALFLSSIALLVNSRNFSDRSVRVAWVVAAASAGLALGTKWTFIGPVAALTVGVWFLVPGKKRLQSWALWLLALILVGGFWYGRNLVAVGNPLPPFHLKLGPISLSSPTPTTPASTVAHFLFHASAWRQYLLPGLRLSFGPAWWAVLSLSFLGLVLAVATGDRLRLVLGLVGLASGVIFLFTPQGTYFGAPLFFAGNLRYADAAVILGLIMLPINPLLSRWRRARWLLGVYAAILVATQFDASIWPTIFFTDRLVAPVRGSDFVLGLLVGVVVLMAGTGILLYRRASPPRRIPAVMWIMVGAIMVVAGFPLQQSYLRDRYEGSSSGTLSSVYAWAQHENNVRIGVIGPFSYVQYPLYGKTSSNYVQYLGIRGPHGSYSSFRSCRAWRETISDGHYSYVLITTGLLGNGSAVTSETPEMRWMDAGKNSTLVLQGLVQVVQAGSFGAYSRYTLYRIDSGFSANGCSGLA
jgi:hypothetical protein